MRIPLSIAWLLCTFQITLAASIDTLRLKGANNTNIVGHLESYPDCTHTLDEQQILTRYKAGKLFKNRENRIVNKGMTRCTYWFALTIKNDTSARNNFVWSFYNDGIRFTLYEVDSQLQSTRVLGQLSSQMPLSERQMRVRSSSFKIPMEPYETKQLLLKTEPTTRQNLYFPTDITTLEDYMNFELEYAFLLGRYYGFFIFAAIFNLFMFLIIRRKFYGYMFGYIVCLLAFNLIEYLYDSYLIPPAVYAYWTRFPNFFFMFVGLFFFVRIFQHFTLHAQRFQNWNRYLNYVNTLIVIVSGGFVLMVTFFPPSYTIAVGTRWLIYIIFSFQFLLLLSNIIYSLIRGNKLTYYYLLSNILLYIAILFYLTNSLNMGDMHPIVSPGNVIFALGFEIVFLMLAFTVKYRNDQREMTRKLLAEQNRKEELSKQLVVLQEKERQAIAKNIHDGFGNTINALKLLLEDQPLQHAEKVHQIMQDANEQFRTLIHQIAPKHLEREGLFESIKHNLNLFGNKNLTFELELIGQERDIDIHIKINVYRIYQELISNIIKHAKATRVQITLTFEQRLLRLHVEDNGIGLDRTLDTQNRGMGFKNILSRVEYHNGHLHMDSSHTGLVSIVEIPLSHGS